MDQPAPRPRQRSRDAVILMVSKSMFSTVETVALFRQCFTGLQQVYGTYDLRTGRVRQVKEPVTDEVIQAHLEGRQPYGVYLLVADRTQALAVDFDTPDLAGPMEFVAAARGYGIAAYIERSKSKGYHVWIFCASAGVSAAKVRTVVRHILDEIGQPRVEVFPKQDRLDPRAPYGSFINAPLFGALVPQDRTVFVEPANPTQPCADQWALLAGVERLTEKLLDQIIGVNELDGAAATLRNPPAASGASATVCYGLPPCGQRMLANGVEWDQRVACYRLARQLRRAGLPYSSALAVLADWAPRNRPIDGKGRIRQDEIEEQTACAYRSNHVSCGCEDPILRAHCDPDCPVRRGLPTLQSADVAIGGDARENQFPTGVPESSSDERSSNMSGNTSIEPGPPLETPGGPVDLRKFDSAYDDAEAARPGEVPDGKYEVQVADVQLGHSQKGDPMLTYEFVVLSGPHAGRHIFKNSVITQDSLPVVKSELRTLGLELQRFSQLPNHLDQLRGLALGVTKRTKGDYANVYLNRLIQPAAGRPERSENVPF